LQSLTQRRLALQIWLRPRVVTVEHQKIKGAGAGVLIIHPTVQSIEDRRSI
jgi:hypothetical protein